MTYQIIVDSCCDLTHTMRDTWNIQSIPLHLYLDEKQYLDNGEVDLTQFMSDMKKCKGKIGSAAPSPGKYKEAYEVAKKSFVITLSSKLSSSYSSAMLGKEMIEQEDTEVHIFDSKSASAGQLLLVLQLKEWIDQGLEYADIIAKMEAFIREMRTYFVLDSVDNLMKNGRLSKVKGRIIQVLNIKPLLGSDGDGQIVHYSNCKGQKNIVKKMVETIQQSGKQTNGCYAVISHCNNIALAEKLKEAIESQYSFKEIVIASTGGVSSLYANDQGIVLAY